MSKTSINQSRKFVEYPRKQKSKNFLDRMVEVVKAIASWVQNAVCGSKTPATSLTKRTASTMPENYNELVDEMTVGLEAAIYEPEKNKSILDQLGKAYNDGNDLAKAAVDKLVEKITNSCADYYEVIYQLGKMQAKGNSLAKAVLCAIAAKADIANPPLISLAGAVGNQAGNGEIFRELSEAYNRGNSLAKAVLCATLNAAADTLVQPEKDAIFEKASEFVGGRSQAAQSSRINELEKAQEELAKLEKDLAEVNSKAKKYEDNIEKYKACLGSFVKLPDMTTFGSPESAVRLKSEKVSLENQIHNLQCDIDDLTGEINKFEENFQSANALGYFFDFLTCAESDKTKAKTLDLALKKLAGFKLFQENKENFENDVHEKLKTALENAPKVVKSGGKSHESEHDAIISIPKNCAEEWAKKLTSSNNYEE
ncbi:MAG: hypothetical protein LBI56_01585 [Puniceicoccales bacterium]|jgi:predicted  nucleic acid-binding Zn-ribbon protein|nr:hypothetical protein [Puniceicoccales bacterium]